MKVTVDIAFKAKDTLVKDRIHHLYFPAYLETSDECLETKGLKLEMGEIVGMSVDCYKGGTCDGSLSFGEYADNPTLQSAT